MTFFGSIFEFVACELDRLLWRCCTSCRLVGSIISISTQFQPLLFSLLFAKNVLKLLRLKYSLLAVSINLYLMREWHLWSKKRGQTAILSLHIFKREYTGKIQVFRPFPQNDAEVKIVVNYVCSSS